MSNTAKAAAKPAPLGRGLSALFGDADSSYQPKPAADNRKGAPAHLPVEFLSPGAFQPRRYFDEESLKGLAESIKERGILEPLLVRPLPGGKDQYEIIAGERRWRAAQIAGLHEVPVLVRELSDREALEFGLIENIQRQDLSPLEEGEGYRRLLDEFGHSQSDLGRIVGKSRSHIANTMRLLTLPEGVRRLIEQGLLSAGHARALVIIKDPLPLAEEIVRKGMNVRQAEALAKRMAENPEVHVRRAPVADSNVAMLEKELARLIGLKVSIAARGKAGSVTIHYQSLEQLDEILKRLRG
ncbi:MAG TPA: ParB/RepB/Spo0J family partition protein [Alphaproteobacteria bacterium]|nr:ParB/RepB/Spo0J family partition protein [Alphaproteobacteria bacterium]